MIRPTEASARTLHAAPHPVDTRTFQETRSSAAMIPPSSKRAAFLVAFPTTGSFAVALDLAAHVLPDYPAFQTMRSASLLAKGIWLALGPLGVVTAFLLHRRPVAGFVLTLIFAAGSLIGGRLLWQQPRPFAVALVALAGVLAGIGAWQARADVASTPPRHDTA